MKLKKILAAICAAAMVLSAGAVTAFAGETVTKYVVYDVSEHGGFDDDDTWGNAWIQVYNSAISVEDAYVFLSDGTSVEVTPVDDGSYAIALIGEDAVVEDASKVVYIVFTLSYDAEEYDYWGSGQVGLNSASTSWHAVTWNIYEGDAIQAADELPIVLVNTEETDPVDESSSVVEETVEEVGTSVEVAEEEAAISVDEEEASEDTATSADEELTTTAEDVDESTDQAVVSSDSGGMAPVAVLAVLALLALFGMAVAEWKKRVNA